MERQSPGERTARRQTVFRGLVALAFLYGCAAFAAGISWLRAALEWTRDDREPIWQQYGVAVLLLSFALLVLLGTRWPRLTSRLFLAVFGLTVVQGLSVTQSAGDGEAAGRIGLIGLLGVPALLAAWLFAWRSRWGAGQPRATNASRKPGRPGGKRGAGSI